MRRIVVDSAHFTDHKPISYDTQTKTDSQSSSRVQDVEARVLSVSA